MNILRYYFIVVLLFPVLFSCRTYKMNIMFKTDREYMVDSIQKLKQDADRNTLIRKNNYITIRVYSNKGERIIDPDYELSKGFTTVIQRDEHRYLVRDNGYVNLPMVGDVRLDGYTVRQADSLLNVEYAKYYYDVFVVTKVVNNRVVVLGGLGGKVIPLENENMNVIEVIALYGGVSSESKANNIRLIRGDLKNPDVSIIDLSTIEGLKKANTNVEPDDIIYIEPIKRLLPETLRDIYPLVSIISTLLSLLILVVTLNRN